MIKLKSLLEQQTDVNDTGILRVLFLGDAYTKSRSSYARQLLENKIVTGNIIASANINAKQLARLASKYASKSYNIVSIYLGDIITKQTDLSKLEKQLNDIISAAGSSGASVVLVQNPERQYGKFKEALNLVKQLNVDASIDIDVDLTTPDGQTALTRKWIEEVNSSFDTKLVTPEEKLKQDTEKESEPGEEAEETPGASTGTGAPSTNDDINPISVVGPLPIFSKYGMRRSGMHYGIDYNCRVGTTIYIAMGGVIQRADNRDSGGWGNMIQVKHDDGAITRYAHMSRMDVTVGQRVERGDLIGLTGGKRGATGAGNSTGPHLHWEYLPAGIRQADGASIAGNYFSASPIIPETPEETPTLASIANDVLNNK